MARTSTEALFLRYRDEGDLGALARVYDRLAPELLALARRLGGPGSRPEDLVQDTFLAALEHGRCFEPGERVEPWLVGILVNRARLARRRAGRALDPSALPAREVARPEDELDRDERRAGLRAAVAELPPGLRAVVEARLAGRDAGEIGRELGISAGAARVRLHRALDRLRGMLPPGLATLFALALMHPSALGAARARVLARARTLGATRGLGALPALAIGATWMTRKTLTTAALVAALSLYVGLRAAAPAPTATVVPLTWREALASPGPQARTQLVPVGTEARNSNQAFAVAGTERAAAPGAPLVLTGRVVDRDGRAVPGAVLGLWSGERARDAFAGFEHGQRLEADGEGRFTARPSGPGFVLVATAEGLVCERGLASRAELLPEAGELELPELLLVPAHRVAGVVLDEEERPLAGAVIDTDSPFSSSSETAVAGVFHFEPGALASGDEAGRARAVSDARGAFELGNFPVARPSVRVELAPFLVRRGMLDDGFDPPRAVLRRGPTLRGRVLDGHGQPAAGARVRRHPHWSNVHTTPPTVTCDADGHFELPAMAAQADPGASFGMVEVSVDREEPQVAITVVHPGHAVATVLPVHPGEERAGRDLDVLVELEPERAIAGRVVTVTGEPAAGVELVIDGGVDLGLGTTWFPPRTSVFAEGLARKTTDAEGRFRFGQLPPGSYVLEAGEVTGDYARLEVEAGNEELAVTLGDVPGGVTLEGRVTDAATGQPVPEFVVVPMVERTGTLHTFSNAAGRFVVHGLEAGSIEVSARADGYAATRLPARSFAPGRHELELRLVPSRSVAVEVVGTHGEPVAGGRVRVLDGGGQPVPLLQRLLSGGGGRMEWRPLEAGRVMLRELPAERLTLEVAVPDHRLRRTAVDLTHPLEEPLRVAVVPMAMTSVVLLVVDAPASQAEDLISTWRQGPEALAAWVARFGVGDDGFPRGLPGGLLEGAAELAFRSEAGDALATATVRSTPEAGSPYSYDVAGANLESSFGWGPLPVLELALPTGRVRVERLVEGEPVPVGELELTVAGGEAYEVLLLPGAGD